MTDVRLRELERRFRETGAVDDEARWLRARVQAGSLPQDRLALAALLGGAAAVAIDDQRLAQIDMLWEAWEAGLSTSPREMVARAFIALGRHFMRSLPMQDEASRHIERDYLALEAAVLGVGAVPRLGILYQAGDPAPVAIARNLYVAAHISFVGMTHSPPGEDRVQRGLDQATRHASNAALLDVVRSELLPWLIGGADPLRERHRTSTPSVGDS